MAAPQTGVLTFVAPTDQQGPDLIGILWIFKAPTDNATAISFAGEGQPQAEAFPLKPGESLEREISNLNLLHFWATTGTDVLHWTRGRP
jgi:hypothetical protein